MNSKPRRSGLQQGVLLVVGILMANSVLGVEKRTGSSQSPLSWQSVEEVETAIDLSAALATARRAIGGLDLDAAPAWIKLAVLTDKHPFGEVFADRPVWIVAFPAVRVDREDKTDSVEVEITGVIDANDGRLLEAFTTAKSVWFRPQRPPERRFSQNPEALASHYQWSVSPCQFLKNRSTVAEVLGSVWKSRSINPKNAGQIILRLRTVACALPAVEVEGKLVPIRRPGPFWIVHVMGTITMSGGGGPLLGQLTPIPADVRAELGRPYRTGLLVLMDVDSSELVSGGHLP